MSDKLSRAEFLRTCAVGLAALHAPHSSAETTSHGESHSQLEDGLLSKRVQYLDKITAGAVVLNFGRHVLLNGAYRGHDLGPRTAVEMNALAFARIGILRQFGGEEGKHIAEHDLAEIKNGMVPVPLLIALSDATTSALRIDERNVFGVVQGSLEAEGSYADVRRPEFSDGVDAWERHSRRVEADLVNKVSQIAAITSLMAPIATTFASSAIAEGMKGAVCHMLYERYYSQRVIEALKAGTQTFDPEATREQSIQDTDTAMNGPMGYSRLLLTLAANSQGTWGIGDPPEIYFALNHMDDLGSVLRAHDLGVINSEVLTLSLNAVWLASIGLAPQRFIAPFLENQYRTAKATAQVLASRDSVGVAFWRSKRFGSKVIEALRNSDDPEGALRRALEAIPHPHIQFWPEEYAQRKLSLLRAFGKDRTLADVVPIPDEDTLKKIADSLELFAQKRDARGIVASLSELQGFLQKRRVNELLEVFRGVHASVRHDIGVASDVAKDDSLSSEELSRKVSEIHNYVKEVQAKSRDASLRAMVEEVVSHKSSDFERLASTLGQISLETVNEALAELTRAAEAEDVIPGMDRDHTDYQDHFLSHSAREVCWALLTQIPSVPGIARLLTELLPSLTGVSLSDKISTTDLKKIAGVLLPLEATMSGVADNVAAYLLGESVLRHFFKRAFGDDVFERYPEVGGSIGIVAKIVAEQAGSLTKLGNGPNFSQTRLRLIPAENAQGVAIDRVAFAIGETLPHKNLFSAATNFCTLGLSIAYLHHIIDKTAEEIASEMARR